MDDREAWELYYRLISPTALSRAALPTVTGGSPCRGLQTVSMYSCLGGSVPVEAVISANLNLSNFFPRVRTLFPSILGHIFFSMFFHQLQLDLERL